MFGVFKGNFVSSVICEEKRMDSNKEKTDVSTLIKAVRAGDQAAFEQIFLQYKPLIDSAIARFTKDELSRSHEDDLRQEATIVFYNAILSYDLESDGVEFGLYAKICVTNAIISELRRLQKTKSEQFSSDLEDSISEIEEEPSERVIERESLQRIDSLIRSALSGFEYYVWCLYTSGKTAGEIAAETGRSKKSIENAVYRIRKKLRETLA